MGLTRSQRESLLKRKGRSFFGCPTTLNYPLDTKSRIASAKSYYRHKRTIKCKGGKNRICRRAKKVGFFNPKYPQSSEWKKWCK